MTDRINSLVVILDRDYREDDMQSLISAFLLFKGVAGVSANAPDLNSVIAETRARLDLGSKIIDVIRASAEISAT